jgi:hypothetical protein
MEAAGKATEAAKQAAAESAKKAAKKAKDLMDETGVTQAVEDYEFGDITRGAVGGVEKAVREATGKEDYKFGEDTPRHSPLHTTPREPHVTCEHQVTSPRTLPRTSLEASPKRRMPPRRNWMRMATNFLL